MSFYTDTAASFTTTATAAPTFHATCTKRGSEAVEMMMEEPSYYLFQQERSHKRIKISSTSYHHQPSFQAPTIQFTSNVPYSVGSTSLTTYYGGESSSQSKKRGRTA